MKKRNILGINGSASGNSSNLSLLKKIAELGSPDFEMKLIENLGEHPHFRTELTDSDVPDKIIELRNLISEADGVIICSPEYVFSIPSRLKNMIEWCVSTTVFSDKPTGILTASANGEKGHEELQLLMRTLMADFTSETTLLIPGIKSKMNRSGDIVDESTEKAVRSFIRSFIGLVKTHS